MKTFLNFEILNEFSIHYTFAKSKTLQSYIALEPAFGNLYSSRNLDAVQKKKIMHQE